jgi:hypothetical protein
VLLIFVFLTLMACTGAHTTVIHAYNDNCNGGWVALYGDRDSLPSGAEKIGRVKVRSAGFRGKRGFQYLVLAARFEANRIGGNCLKVITPNPEDYSYMNELFKADIYRICTDTNVVFTQPKRKTVDTSMATLHLYRLSNYAGCLILYPVYVGDSMVYKAINSSSESVKIQPGKGIKVWAQTESESMVTIDFEAGKHYYIRCELVDGFFIGVPQLRLVQEDIGRFEFGLIR